VVLDKHDVPNLHENERIKHEKASWICGAGCMGVYRINLQLKTIVCHLVSRVDSTYSIGHNEMSHAHHPQYSDWQGTPPQGMALIHMQTALGKY
jgi:hypothetical protein